jgi:diaminohydroxyphosphoribosylaminopyrimidine deaminase / 5-amino-6-(5-phosphoribosylamino)uracil reductase
MVWLAQRETNEVHVEAGAGLCGALLQLKLVDEIVVYMAPHIMGANARGLFDLPGLDRMQDRIDLEISDLRQVGKDIRITARPLYAQQ